MPQVLEPAAAGRAGDDHIDVHVAIEVRTHQPRDVATCVVTDHRIARAEARAPETRQHPHARGVGDHEVETAVRIEVSRRDGTDRLGRRLRKRECPERTASVRREQVFEARHASRTEHNEIEVGRGAGP